MTDDPIWTKDPIILIDKIYEIIPYNLPSNRTMNAMMRLAVICIVVFISFSIGILNILIIIIVLIILSSVSMSSTPATFTPIDEALTNNILGTESPIDALNAEAYNMEHSNNNELYTDNTLSRNLAMTHIHGKRFNLPKTIYYDHLDALGLYNANF